MAKALAPVTRGPAIGALLLAACMLPNAPAGAGERDRTPLLVAQAGEGEIAFWESVKDSKDPAELAAYLDAFPGGRFAPLARLRLKKLQTDPARESPAEPPPAQERQAAPSAPAEGSGKTTFYAALDLFGDVLERVRSDYYRPVDEPGLVQAAIAGALKSYPSEQAAEIAAGEASQKCAARKQDARYACISLASDVFDALRAAHPADSGAIVGAAIDGMLASLDPLSTFFDASRSERQRQDARTVFGGIGAELTMEDGLVKIVAPLDGSPAERAGLQAQDLIATIDGAPVPGMTLSQAVARFRGEPGTPIVLTVARPGIDKPVQVTVVREIIEVRSVEARAEGDVGYLRVSRFADTTQAQFAQAVEDLEGRIGTGLKGFVVDLRNSPGGLFGSVIAVADDLLEEGVIVTLRARDSANDRKTYAGAGDIARGRPIVVLINGGTASGAEILAGALADNGRAAIVGTPSFGRGTVQTIIPLGSRGSLRLTTASYHTPSGRSIQDKGLDPDFLVRQEDTPEAEAQGRNLSSYVPSDRSRDTQLQYAIAWLRDEGRGPPPRAAPASGAAPVLDEIDLQELEKLD